MSNTIDIDHLRNWIGQRDSDSDAITPELVKRFSATLSGHTQIATDTGSPIPLGIHWCLALPAVTRDKLGADGHPAKGGFLPPVPLPRRMWASSRILFHKGPSVGARIEKSSTIADVVLKQSAASGPLVFVHIDHKYVQGAETLIQDRQTIVYRQPSTFRQGEVQPSKMQSLNAVRSLRVTPDSTLLFRYSALTFNGHRIHYDHNYTTAEEGYPALVVHGPLTATLLMNLAQATRPEYPLRAFEFRAVAPAFVDQVLQLSVNASETDQDASGTVDTGIHLDARDHRGELVMTANAQFGEHFSRQQKQAY